MEVIEEATTSENSLFRATPFGFFCNLCKKSFVFNCSNSLNTHVKKQGKKRKVGGEMDPHHAYINAGFSWRDIFFQLQQQMMDLRASSSLDIYIVARSKTFHYKCSAVGCGYHHQRQRNLTSHITHCHPGEIDVGSTKQYVCRTTCGQILLLESPVLRGKILDVSHLDPSTPIVVEADPDGASPVTHLEPARVSLSQRRLGFTEILAIVTPFVGQTNEFGYQYTGCLQQLVRKFPSNFEEKMTELHGLWSDDIAPHEKSLALITVAAEIWLNEHARLDVQSLNGLIRSAIMILGERTLMDSEVTYNSTFSMRQSVPRLLKELVPLLKFIWRQTFLCMSPFVTEVEQLASADQIVQSFFLPRLMYRVLMEEQESITSTSLAELYCKSRFFKCSPDGSSVVIRSAGESASNLAATMHLFRLAFCSRMVFMGEYGGMKGDAAIAEAERLRGGLLNSIAPLIRQMREIQQNKPRDIHTFVVGGGDIVVEDVTFVKGCWRRLMPNMMAMAREDVLPRVFDGDDYRSFLDVDLPVSMSMDGSFDVEQSDGTKLRSCNLLVRDDVPRTVLQQYSSLVELAFLGLGMGACRETEVERMDSSRACFRNADQTCLYYPKTIKAFSIRSKKGVLVEHQLPRSVARLFLLFHFVVFQSGVFDVGSGERHPGQEQLIFPYAGLSNRSWTMADVAKKLFRLRSKPDNRVVRQAFTTLTNMLFPSGAKNDEWILVAEDDVAAASGHSASTARDRYASIVVGSTGEIKETSVLRLERQRQTYHTYLGEDGVGQVVPRQSLSCQVLSEGQLLGGIAQLYGVSRGLWRSHTQREAILAAAMGNHHLILTIPCGGGKTLVGLLPVFVRHIVGYRRRMTIFVVPYKFLQSSLFESVKQLTGKVRGFVVASISGNECSQNVRPTAFEGDEFPHLLFLSYNALANICRYHLELVREFAEKGCLHNIIVDEAHIVFLEWCFRSTVMFWLKYLVQFAVPVVLMSGTLPPKFAMRAQEFFGLHSVKSIGSDDLFGEVGFVLSVKKVSDPVEEATSLVGDNTDRSIHILCASTVDATKIAESLDLWGIERLVATGSSTPVVQSDVAKQWAAGYCKVLVTTSVGLVGIDSSACDFVIVVGILFNVMSLVQGMLRIRPEQRSQNARVIVLSNGYVRSDMALQNDVAFQRLSCDDGPLLASDRNLFDKQCSAEGLLSVMESTSVCRVAMLSEIMGWPRSSCGLCDICKGDGNAFVRNAQTYTSECNTIIGQRESGMIVREWMIHYCCLVCGKSDCDGEGCMPPTSCWACGAIGHRARTPGICPLKMEVMKRDLAGKACFSCFDLGVVCKHSPSVLCPIQRRLRRLLFHSYHQETKRAAGTFNDFLAKVYQNESTFWRWLTESPKVKEVIGEMP